MYAGNIGVLVSLLNYAENFGSEITLKYVEQSVKRRAGFSESITLIIKLRSYKTEPFCGFAP